MNLAADKGGFSGLPPLALYVHLPWCVRKCPYCDFNSHAAPTDIPAHDYFLALLADLESELPDVWGRPVHSIFFGGGTPSLFGASWFAGFLRELRSRLRLAPDLEITLEVNPGTTERDSFAAYRDAGVNRVSLGVQSFNDQSLERIGRIHGRAEIDRSIDSMHRSGLSNFNIDLMFGLPDQTVSEAVKRYPPGDCLRAWPPVPLSINAGAKYSFSCRSSLLTHSGNSLGNAGAMWTKAEKCRIWTI